MLLTFSHFVFANNCIKAMTSNAVYGDQKGILNVPLVELIGNTTNETAFWGASLKKENTTLLLIASQPLNEDCGLINTPTATFDFDIGELFIPNIQVTENNSVKFYDALLKIESDIFIISSLEKGEGRYSSVIRDGETNKVIVDATVSLNGIEAESTTNAEGFFTVFGISEAICQTLTVNATGFKSLSQQVDIRFSGELKACEL